MSEYLDTDPISELDRLRERIRELERRICTLTEANQRADATAEELEAKNARLREAISNAPCPFRICPRGLTFAAPCDRQCWKRTAL